MVGKKKRASGSASHTRPERPEWVTRLKWARERHFETVEEAAKAHGWNKNTYKSLENGTRAARVSVARLEELAAAFNVSVDFLTNGTNPPPDYNKGAQVHVSTRLKPSVRTVPKYSLQQAAYIRPDAPLPRHDKTTVLVASPELGPRIFCLELLDESMVAPDPSSRDSFRPGEELIFDLDATPRPGDFVAVRRGTAEDVIVRQYRSGGRDQRGNEIIELVPLNPNYRSQTLSKREQIIGKLVRHSRKY